MIMMIGGDCDDNSVTFTIWDYRRRKEEEEEEEEEEEGDVDGRLEMVACKCDT